MFYFAGLIHVNNPFYLNTKKVFFIFSFVQLAPLRSLIRKAHTLASLAHCVRFLLARLRHARNLLRSHKRCTPWRTAYARFRAPSQLHLRRSCNSAFRSAFTSFRSAFGFARSLRSHAPLPTFAEAHTGNMRCRSAPIIYAPTPQDILPCGSFAYLSIYRVLLITFV